MKREVDARGCLRCWAGKGCANTRKASNGSLLSAHTPSTSAPLLSFSLLVMARGGDGYDFTPILTHYLFLITSVLAVVSPFVYRRFPEWLTICLAGGMVHCVHRP